MIPKTQRRVLIFPVHMISSTVWMYFLGCRKLKGRDGISVVFGDNLISGFEICCAHMDDTNMVV